MFARPLLVFVSLALIACTDRPLGETETGTSNATTGEPPPATSGTTTGSTTASPATTLEPTTAVPPLPTTTTATSDDSVGTTVDPNITLPGGPDFFDPGPPGLMGCSLDALPGTMISGTSELGPFMAPRAYFGWIGFGSDPFQPLLLFVSPEADPAVEVQQTNGSTGAILYGDVSTDPFAEGGWVGEWPAHFDLFDQGQLGSPTRPDSVVIDALAGNWTEFDPADPPRLVGSLQGAIAGPFDAVFCDQLNEFIIPE
jgi:hypothetical protein